MAPLSGTPTAGSTAAGAPRGLQELWRKCSITDFRTANVFKVRVTRELAVIT
jgi:hypothetical protein